MSRFISFNAVAVFAGAAIGIAASGWFAGAALGQGQQRLPGAPLVPLHDQHTRTPTSFALDAPSFAELVAVETQSAPLTGFTRFADDPRLALPGGVLQIDELEWHVAADHPLGAIRITALSPVGLEVSAQGGGSGSADLDVWLPLYDEHCLAQAEMQWFPGPPAGFFEVQLMIHPASPWLEPAYMIALHALQEQDGTTAQRINKLIDDLDAWDIATRDAATHELIRIGRPALRSLEDALANDPSPEAENRLRDIIEQVRGVTLQSAEATDGAFRIWTFKYTIHVPANGKAWTTGVYDIHFVVGTPAQVGGVIDHSASNITHTLPEGWMCRYDPAAGEYVCEAWTAATPPLTPCTAYQITIETGSVPDGKLPQDTMGYHWTDGANAKLEGADHGVTKGPIFK